MTNRKNSDTAYAKAKDLYEQSDMSLVTIAKFSVELLGQSIPLNTLKAKSAEEGWYKQATNAEDLITINTIESIINTYLDDTHRGSLTVKEITELVISLDRLQRMKMRFKTPGSSGRTGTSTAQGRTMLLGGSE
jgi:hypothetical protein